MAVGFGLREECGESSGCSYFSVYHYILGKLAKTRGGEWQVEKLGLFFFFFPPRYVTIFLMPLCLSSGFSVHSFRVQDCNTYSYCIA